MAPGYQSINALNKQSTSMYSTYSSLDTIDSFEILEQTVIKQKKLTKTKKNDLRLRILLKRTFDLVCDIMDRENGILNTTTTTSDINNDDNIDELLTLDNDLLFKEQQPQLQSHITQTDQFEYEQKVPLLLENENDYHNQNQFIQKTTTLISNNHHNYNENKKRKSHKRKHENDDCTNNNNNNNNNFKRLKSLDLNMKLNFKHHKQIHRHEQQLEC
jgi:hypothetical protein